MAEALEVPFRTYQKWVYSGQRPRHGARLIHRARSLGFSVNDVASLIALWRDKQRASAQVRALASEHVRRIDQKLAELQSMRETLVDLIERCHGDSRPDCPILKDLAGGSDARPVAERA